MQYINDAVREFEGTSEEVRVTITDSELAIARGDVEGALKKVGAMYERVGAMYEREGRREGGRVAGRGNAQARSSKSSGHAGGREGGREGGRAGSMRCMLAHVMAPVLQQMPAAGAAVPGFRAAYLHLRCACRCCVCGSSALLALCVVHPPLSRVQAIMAG